MYLSYRFIKKNLKIHRMYRPKDHKIVCQYSATQGAGGSFKNRKPIGEAGCCESRMAGRIH